MVSRARFSLATVVFPFASFAVKTFRPQPNPAFLSPRHSSKTTKPCVLQFDTDTISLSFLNERPFQFPAAECHPRGVLMSYRKRLLLLLMLAFAISGSTQEMPEGRLMRFPDIYKDKIVFMYGGDLWLASGAGGDARRITSDPGRELFPKFSPDGKWIAFTGQYDGNFNVYVMPAQGGQPRQLTFYQGAAAQLSDRMGVHNEVLTWTPDSKRVVFLSRGDSSNGWTKRQFSVSIEGALPEPLPVSEGGLSSFSPDGTKIAYNPIFRNFLTGTRYTGGLAQAIAIYDL